jgi:hypothetical protein
LREDSAIQLEESLLYVEHFVLHILIITRLKTTVNVSCSLAFASFFSLTVDSFLTSWLLDA